MSGSKLVVNVVVAVCAVATGVVAWLLMSGSDGEVPPLPPPPPPAIEQPEPKLPPPDIILITVDTLRADRLGAYGYDKANTPFVDELAARGTTFIHATVPHPRTTPALASLNTGLWPQNHGSRQVWQKVKGGTLLAQVLKKRGYETFGISANQAASSKQKLGKGFRKFIDPHKGPNNAALITKRITKALKKVDPQKPLFLWAHFIDPHWAYNPPPKFYKDAPAAPKCRKIYESIGPKYKHGMVLSNWNNVASEALEDCSALYDAEITFTDQYIAKLAKNLESIGRWEDAIIVFTSDHGENLGEDGYYYDHGPSVHDAGMRVPLIMAGRGIPEGRTDEGVTRMEDVMPTLLQLADIPRDAWPKMDGTDFSWRWNPKAPRPEHPVTMALVEAGSAMHKPVHSFLVSGRKGGFHCIHDDRYTACLKRGENKPTFHDRRRDPGLDKPTKRLPKPVKDRLLAAFAKWEPESARRRAVRNKEFKLVEFPQLDGSYSRKLFHLVSDPAEQTDVIDQHPSVAREMGAVLDRWTKGLPLYEAREHSEAELEELRALGYIQ